MAGVREAKPILQFLMAAVQIVRSPPQRCETFVLSASEETSL